MIDIICRLSGCVIDEGAKININALIALDPSGNTLYNTLLTLQQLPNGLMTPQIASNIVAWCELREAMRNFRTERVTESALADGFFRGDGDRLRKEWIAGWKTQPA